MELLKDMGLFVEVVRARNFRRAAETLDMPSSTLSRRISLLEKAIGLRLLHRTTRKVELTEAGQLYYERCKRIVDEARLAHEQLGDMLMQPSGVLRISSSVDFATFVLAPLLPEFAARYPGIGFDFDLTPRKVDLVAEPFDIAIRMGEQPASNLVARLLARVPQALFAAPDYLQRAGTPRRPVDLAKHECLRFLGGRADEWTLHRREEVQRIDVQGRIRVNSVGMVHRLARQGLGIAVLSDALVVEDVANGSLRRVLPAWRSVVVPVYAMTETRLLPAKVQRFIEFLKERLGQGEAARPPARDS
ncbi:LysR family transcriptional regulator [Dyella sp. 2RAB6]|uniref:LysR family transcriptional regulator n=1 Tax=Dyella sp. 2RAB6 TaxID=3232992 RepID=UPI003F90EB16